MISEWEKIAKPQAFVGDHSGIAIPNPLTFFVSFAPSWFSNLIPPEGSQL